MIGTSQDQELHESCRARTDNSLCSMDDAGDVAASTFAEGSFTISLSLSLLLFSSHFSLNNYLTPKAVRYFINNLMTLNGPGLPPPTPRTTGRPRGSGRGGGGEHDRADIAAAQDHITSHSRFCVFRGRFLSMQ